MRVPSESNEIQRVLEACPFYGGTQGGLALLPSTGVLESLLLFFGMTTSSQSGDEYPVIDGIKRLNTQVSNVLSAKIDHFHSLSQLDQSSFVKSLDTFVSQVMALDLSTAGLGECSVLELTAVMARNTLTYLNYFFLAELGAGHYKRTLDSMHEGLSASLEAMQSADVDAMDGDQDEEVETQTEVGSEDGMPPRMSVDVHIPFQEEFITMADGVLREESYRVISECIKLEAGGIVPLKPRRDFPDSFWQLFQQAQLEHLHRIGRQDLYQFDRRVVSGGYACGIYPRIQAFGGIDNKAVDVPVANTMGRVSVAARNGTNFLLAGSQLSIGDHCEPTRYALHRAIRAVVKNKCKNIHLSFTEADFGDVTLDQIKKIINKNIAAHQIILPNRYSEKIRLSVARSGRLPGPKQVIVKAMISQIDSLISHVKESHKKPLRALRTDIICALFEKTNTFRNVYDRFKSQLGTVVLPVRQFCDVRGMASVQTSYVVLPPQNPEVLIQSHYSLSSFNGLDGLDREQDDVVELNWLSPLDMVAAPTKYSHDLIALWTSLMHCHTSLRLALYKPAMFKRAYSRLMGDSQAVKTLCQAYHATLSPPYLYDPSLMPARGRDRLGSMASVDTASSRHTASGVPSAGGSQLTPHPSG